MRNRAGGRAEWLEHRERGLTPAIRLAASAILRIGRPAARLMLYPVCLYFLVFSLKSRPASRSYLRRVLGRPASFADLFRHYHCFAACMLDRLFFLDEQADLFDLRVHGAEIVDMIHAAGGGGFLVGAHIGSFEAVRAAKRARPDLRISLLMYEENARKTNAVLNAINPDLATDVIGLGRLNAMLEVQDRLERDHFVGVLADRSLKRDDGVRRQFLGETAMFPSGPFQLAAILKRPVVLMIGLYRGGRRYDVHFETLADFSGVARAERAEAIDLAIAAYIGRLEHYCHSAPFNWFNFYEFWK